MSETSKTKKIPDNLINYIVFGNENELEINETGANTQEAVHNVPGIPMEISAVDCTITNETPDGRTAVLDNAGNIIGYLDGDGTLNRKLAEIDKNKAREGTER